MGGQLWLRFYFGLEWVGEGFGGCLKEDGGGVEGRGYQGEEEGGDQGEDGCAEVGELGGKRGLGEGVGLGEGCVDD